MSFNYLLCDIEQRKNTNNPLLDKSIDFIIDDCVDLRCDKNKINDYTGKSLNENQIPYNMEKDIDRLCFANAIKRFVESGKKEDAFDIYFCYLEMFIGDYEKSRRMIELLSEFETNGSELLMKHRDHYSHSVYVFILGLAIYESNNIYKDAYKKYYNIEDNIKAAHHFLEFWGFASLFHDIGYPFELPFEQVCSYFEVEGEDRKGKPFVAYRDLESAISINDNIKEKLKKIYNCPDENFDTTNELFAYILTKKLSDNYGFSKEKILKDLQHKPTEPNKFSHFMDHAYFSASILFKKLLSDIDFRVEHIDALIAILMHNSLYKFCITDITEKSKDNKPFKVDLHPLAFLLMLCDELQCWDRTAYGRNSKKELHPMDCEFSFSNDTIKAVYVYDKNEEDKVSDYANMYDTWKSNGCNGDAPKKLKAFSDMYIKSEKGITKFQEDIEKIVDLSNIKLDVEHDLKEKNYSRNKTFLSDSNFINLYNFAVVLNGRWSAYEEWKKLKTNKEKYNFVINEENNKKFNEMFKKLSLEYKLSNINQAKAFAEYMNDIGCFYTSKSVDFQMVEKFTDIELLIIGKKEHLRWLKEKYSMGWKYGEPKDKNERENTRLHPDMIPNFNHLSDELTIERAEENYHRLNKDEQDKDTEPMICMLAMLKMFDGLRIYKLR